MNYIKEINVFYQRQETNPLSANAANLWHALMHVNNRAGWKQKFTVSVTVLCCKASLSNSTFKRARRELQEKGYIRYESRGGNRSAMYEIVSSKQSISYDNNDEGGDEQSTENQKNDGSLNRTTNDVTKNDKDQSTPPQHLTDNLDHNDGPLFKQNKTKQKISTTAVESVKFFQDNIGKTNPFLIRKILKWKKRLGEPLVLKAMQRAIKRGKGNWGYIEAILQDWLAKGFKTVEDAEIEIEQFKREQTLKLPQNFPRKSKEVVPDWFHQRDKEQSQPAIDNASEADIRAELAELIETFA